MIKIVGIRNQVLIEKLDRDFEHSSLNLFRWPLIRWIEPDANARVLLIRSLERFARLDFLRQSKSESRTFEFRQKFGHIGCFVFAKEFESFRRGSFVLVLII